MDPLSLLIALINLVRTLFGLKPKLSKSERQEAREYAQGTDLGQVKEHAAQAEQAVVAQQHAMDLETRMQEAQAKVTAGQPPMEQPHEGTDLFNQD